MQSSAGKNTFSGTNVNRNLVPKDSPSNKPNAPEQNSENKPNKPVQFQEHDNDLDPRRIAHLIPQGAKVDFRTRKKEILDKPGHHLAPAKKTTKEAKFLSVAKEDDDDDDSDSDDDIRLTAYQTTHTKVQKKIFDRDTGQTKVTNEEKLRVGEIVFKPTGPVDEELFDKDTPQWKAFLMSQKKLNSTSVAALGNQAGVNQAEDVNPLPCGESNPNRPNSSHSSKSSSSSVHSDSPARTRTDNSRKAPKTQENEQDRFKYLKSQAPKSNQNDPRNAEVNRLKKTSDNAAEKPRIHKPRNYGPRFHEAETIKGNRPKENIVVANINWDNPPEKHKINKPWMLHSPGFNEPEMIEANRPKKNEAEENSWNVLPKSKSDTAFNKLKKAMERDNSKSGEQIEHKKDRSSFEWNPPSQRRRSDRASDDRSNFKERNHDRRHQLREQNENERIKEPYRSREQTHDKRLADREREKDETYKSRGQKHDKPLPSSQRDQDEPYHSRKQTHHKPLTSSQRDQDEPYQSRKQTHNKPLPCSQQDEDEPYQSRKQAHNKPLTSSQRDQDETYQSKGRTHNTRFTSREQDHNCRHCNSKERISHKRHKSRDRDQDGRSNSRERIIDKRHKSRERDQDVQCISSERITDKRHKSGERDQDERRTSKERIPDKSYKTRKQDHDDRMISRERISDKRQTSKERDEDGQCVSNERIPDKLNKSGTRIKQTKSKDLVPGKSHNSRKRGQVEESLSIESCESITSDTSSSTVCCEEDELPDQQPRTFKSLIPRPKKQINSNDFRPIEEFPTSCIPTEPVSIETQCDPNQVISTRTQTKRHTPIEYISDIDQSKESIPKKPIKMMNSNCYKCYIHKKAKHNYKDEQVSTDPTELYDKNGVKLTGTTGKSKCPRVAEILAKYFQQPEPTKFLPDEPAQRSHDHQESWETICIEPESAPEPFRRTAMIREAHIQTEADYSADAATFAQCLLETINECCRLSALAGKTCSCKTGNRDSISSGSHRSSYPSEDGEISVSSGPFPRHHEADFTAPELLGGFSLEDNSDETIYNVRDENVKEQTFTFEDGNLIPLEENEAATRTTTRIPKNPLDFGSNDVITRTIENPTEQASKSERRESNQQERATRMIDSSIQTPTSVMTSSGSTTAETDFENNEQMQNRTTVASRMTASHSGKGHTNISTTLDSRKTGPTSAPLAPSGSTKTTASSAISGSTKTNASSAISGSTKTTASTAISGSTKATASAATSGSTKTTASAATSGSTKSTVPPPPSESTKTTTSSAPSSSSATLLLKKSHKLPKSHSQNEDYDDDDLFESFISDIPFTEVKYDLTNNK